MTGHDIGANFAFCFAPRTTPLSARLHALRRSAAVPPHPFPPGFAVPAPHPHFPSRPARFTRYNGLPESLKTRPARPCLSAQRFLSYSLPRFMHHNGSRIPQNPPISTRHTSLVKTPATLLFSVTFKNLPETKSHVSMSLFSPPFLRLVRSAPRHSARPAPPQNPPAAYRNARPHSSHGQMSLRWSKL